ncbi:MAG: GNAT family N-acetyltransferase, partial [Lachnospiraceae bacterium]|nr:GNAT family N-acetyltransferase [Lachnospiraceae bacterium]
PALHEILTDPEVSRFSGEPARSLDERLYLHEAYIRFAYHFRGFGLWGVFLRETGQLIGRCGLEENGDSTGTAPDAGRIEIGYLLAPGFWGRGYALECTRAVLRYAFEELGLPAVYAVVARDNSRSEALVRKLGFQLCGTTVRNGVQCLEFILKKI